MATRVMPRPLARPRPSTQSAAHDRISDQAPDFLPEKAKGGKYVLGTLKMQRTTLVKAYLKWLDSKQGGKKAGSSSKNAAGPGKDKAK